jgi:hypothetical protein
VVGLVEGCFGIQGFVLRVEGSCFWVQGLGYLLRGFAAQEGHEDQACLGFRV